MERSEGGLARCLAMALSHNSTATEKLRAISAAAHRLGEAQDHLELFLPGFHRTRNLLDLASASASKGVRLEALNLVVLVVGANETAWSKASDRTKRNYESWSMRLAIHLDRTHASCRRGLGMEGADVVQAKWLELARVLVRVTPYPAFEKGFEMETELLNALVSCPRPTALLALAQYMAKDNVVGRDFAPIATALRRCTTLSLEDQNTLWDLLSLPPALERLDESFVDGAIECAQSRSRCLSTQRPRTCSALTFLQKKAESSGPGHDSIRRLVDGELDHLPATQMLALVAVLPLPHGQDMVERNLASGSEDDRASAVRCYGCRLVPSDSNIRRLVEFCHDSSALVRARATWSLANLGETWGLVDWEENVLQMTRDPSLACLGAIRVLGQLGTLKAVTRLSNILDSDERRPKVLWNTCAALTKVLVVQKPPLPPQDLMTRIAQSALRLTMVRGNFKVRIGAFDLLAVCHPSAASSLAEPFASFAKSSIADLELESQSIPFSQQLHLQKLRDRWSGLVS